MTLPGDIQVVHKEKDRKGGERLEEGTGKTVKCLSGYQPTGDSVIGTLVIRGGSRGRVQGVRPPPPPPPRDDLRLVFCKKKLCGLLVLKKSRR